jgi:eukaryotic-like serine/threonine-protein kinase
MRAEAQAASALTHPNIAVVYDVGEHEGSTFIAMEHVEGRRRAKFALRCRGGR